MSALEPLPKTTSATGYQGMEAVPRNPVADLGFYNLFTILIFI